ncbi:MAG: hypothetical protein ACLR23_07685 [Clostridia bacterium]
MSFSSQVKTELAEHMGTARHCMLAELAALMNTCARVSLAPSEIQFQGENEATLKKSLHY